MSYAALESGRADSGCREPRSLPFSSMHRLVRGPQAGIGCQGDSSGSSSFAGSHALVIQVRVTQLPAKV